MHLFALAHAMADPMPNVAWDWSQTHRFFVEAEVQIPQFIWMEAQFNRAVRGTAWQLQAVLECRATGKRSRRHTQVRCDIDDLGLRVATTLGDRGRALPVIEEYDHVLTDAAIELEVREDGRISNYDVLGVQTRNLRTRGRLQTLRLIVRPLVAALEVRIPTDQQSPWFFRESHLCTMPTMWGTLAPVEGVATGIVRNGDVLETASSAKGLMNPGENENLLTCDTVERSFFALGVGPARHTFEMHGELTPGSPAALGTATIPYTQRGQLVRLEPGARPLVFASDELIPDQLPPSGALNNVAPPPSRR